MPKLENAKKTYHLMHNFETSASLFRLNHHITFYLIAVTNRYEKYKLLCLGVSKADPRSAKFLSYDFYGFKKG